MQSSIAPRVPGYRHRVCVSERNTEQALCLNKTPPPGAERCPSSLAAWSSPWPVSSGISPQATAARSRALRPRQGLRSPSSCPPPRNLPPPLSRPSLPLQSNRPLPPTDRACPIARADQSTVRFTVACREAPPHFLSENIPGVRGQRPRGFQRRAFRSGPGLAQRISAHPYPQQQTSANQLAGCGVSLVNAHKPEDFRWPTNQTQLPAAPLQAAPRRTVRCPDARRPRPTTTSTLPRSGAPRLRPGCLLQGLSSCLWRSCGSLAALPTRHRRPHRPGRPQAKLHRAQRPQPMAQRLQLMAQRLRPTRHQPPVATPPRHPALLRHPRQWTDAPLPTPYLVTDWPVAPGRPAFRVSAVPLEAPCWF